MIIFRLSTTVVYNIGVLAHFGPKKSEKKLTNFIKIFELYQVFMYNFLCQIVPIFPVYILFTKRIETICPGGIETHFGQGILAHFRPKKSDKKS